MSTRIDIAERYGRYLSSRRLGRDLRDFVVAEVQRCGADQVTVCFDGVESISNSFADSFLGLLVAERGRSWVERHIRVEGLHPDDQQDLEALLALRAAQAAVA
jgi:hypothetical protein